tara:strand:+ start:7769 stop:8863 length:1095 start_codon:yes stop_codon:yes gene_type:complete
MKLNKVYFILTILIIISSCSSDDDAQNDSQVVIDSEENFNNVSSQNSDHLITTYSGNKVSSLLMASGEYSSWKSEDHFSEASYREAIVKDIYKEFSDKYDFIFLVLNEEEIPEGINYYGKNVGVSNNITGIGGGIYNYTSNYGSSGKLKSVMQLSSLSFLQNGPALHELMHNWGNYALPTENVDQTGSNLTSYSYYGHWGFTGGSTRGQLGGFKQSTLEEFGDNMYSVDSFGPFANGGNSVPYNELELYLMGMTSINSVNQFDLFNNITSLEVTNNKFTFTANRLNFGPAELESLLGERSPSSTDSQKEFDLLLIVLTNNPLTDNQWTSINNAAEWFSFKGEDEYSSYNFWEATNGIGSINIGN